MGYQLLPPLSQDEYESLKASIDRNGVLQAVELDTEGNVLDGHHRVRACQELDINSWPTIVKEFGSEAEKQAYVYMVNLARRQVSRDQLKEIREQQKELALALRQQGKSRSEIAGILGIPEGTIARWSGEFGELSGEALYRAMFARELGGKEEVQCSIGKIDIVTPTHAYEIEPIHTWKYGLGQAIAYANVLNLKPGLALYGPRPADEKWLAIQDAVKRAGCLEMRTKFWERPNKLPGKLIKSWMAGEELTKTQKEILAQFGIYGESPLLACSTEQANKSSTLTGECRLSIPQEAKADIFERAQEGDIQAQIAADYGVSQGRISQVVKEEKKKRRKEAKGQEKAAKPKPDMIMPTIMVGDAAHLNLPDEYIEAIITSPPYNLGSESWPMGGQGREPRENGIGYEDAMPEDEYQAWQIECLVEWYRVAKPGASLFYNHKVRQKEGEMIHPLDWLRNFDNPWLLRQEIIWDRESTHNHCPSLLWPHDERIYWMTKGKPSLPEDGLQEPGEDSEHDKKRSTIWRFHGPEPNTWHPAPFPPELPRRCLKLIGRLGIIVLDPFGGRMTTCVVASKLGYKAIGIDINPEYVQRACKENGWMSENET